MDPRATNPERSAWTAIRRFARGAPKAQEQCDLCSQSLAADHQHLVDLSNRQLLCACDACAILFSCREGAKYRRVPRDVRSLPNFRLSDQQWDSLGIPIALAFFFHNSPAGKVVAVYPSPAGPTESLLDLEPWQEVVDDNPVLKGMEPDTEALLINRLGAPSYWLVPIDECYRLIGLIRTHWRGISGGTEIWGQIEQFFAGLRERAYPAEEETNA